VPKQFRIQVVQIETKQSPFLDLCSYKQISRFSHTVQKLPVLLTSTSKSLFTNWCTRPLL